MATEIYKVLGQSNPVASTLTDVYTVPSSTEAVISTIVIANRSGATKSFSVSVAIAGAASSDEQFIASGTTITGNGIVTLTIGVTLAATDVVRVFASSQDLSFNLFGTEIT